MTPHHIILTSIFLSNLALGSDFAFNFWLARLNIGMNDVPSADYFANHRRLARILSGIIILMKCDGPLDLGQLGMHLRLHWHLRDYLLVLHVSMVVERVPYDLLFLRLALVLLA